MKEEINKQRKRVMIIEWRWESLSEYIINDTFFESEAGHKWGNQFADADNPYYDEFFVGVESAQEITWSIPESKVVRIRMDEIGRRKEDYLSIISQLVDHYKKEESEVYVFLHRKEGFDPEQVEVLLERSKADKCFLFSGKRDHIYYDFAKDGLLGESGEFFRISDGPQQEEIQVADETKKIVYQVYFDKTWRYYQHEFDIKIFELMEDFLRCFYGVFPDGELWTQQQWHDQLKKQENSLLLLRVKSFIDELPLSKTEEKELVEFERKNMKTYVFDDCKINLEQEKGIQLEYSRVSDLIYGLFFDERKKQEVVKKTVRQHLQTLQKEFGKLIEKLAEKINN